MSLLRKFGFIFVVLTALSFAANYLHFHRVPTCSDCFFPYGLPFTLYHDGGYAGGAAIVWSGLFADVAVLLVAVAAGTFVWHLADRPR